MVFRVFFLQTVSLVFKLERPVFIDPGRHQNNQLRQLCVRLNDIGNFDSLCRSRPDRLHSNQLIVTEYACLRGIGDSNRRSSLTRRSKRLTSQSSFRLEITRRVSLIVGRGQQTSRPPSPSKICFQVPKLIPVNRKPILFSSSLLLASGDFSPEHSLELVHRRDAWQKNRAYAFSAKHRASVRLVVLSTLFAVAGLIQAPSNVCSTSVAIIWMIIELVWIFMFRKNR